MGYCKKCYCKKGVKITQKMSPEKKTWNLWERDRRTINFYFNEKRIVAEESTI